MALTSTVHALQLELADVDRGVYASPSLHVARHPSESAPYLVARILAFALEYSEDLAFTRGLSASDEPAIWARDPTGRLTAWIEVGTPDAARLHKARKAVDDVAVYCHKDFENWLRLLAGDRVHRAETIRLYALGRELVTPLAEGLERRADWSITRSDGVVYVDTGSTEVAGAIARVPWPERA